MKKQFLEIKRMADVADVELTPRQQNIACIIADLNRSLMSERVDGGWVLMSEFNGRPDLTVVSREPLQVVEYGTLRNRAPKLEGEFPITGFIGALSRRDADHPGFESTMLRPMVTIEADGVEYASYAEPDDMDRLMPKINECGPRYFPISGI